MGILIILIVIVTLISIEVQLRRLNKTNAEIATLLKKNEE